MRFLTKAEIIEGLPKTTWDFDAEMNGPIHQNETSTLKAAKYLYGPHMMPLNLTTAKACIGHKVFAIGGQTWNASTKKNKIKEIQYLTVHGFTSDSNYEATKYRHESVQYDDIAISLSKERRSDFIFGVYDCHVGPFGIESFGSGSGCDPIYIFAKDT
jgi:hypothetical protein